LGDPEVSETWNLGIDRVTVRDSAVEIRGPLGGAKVIPLRSIADVRVSGILRDLRITDNAGRVTAPKGVRRLTLKHNRDIAAAITAAMR
jgi:hypothetical protein